MSSDVVTESDAASVFRGALKVSVEREREREATVS